MGIFECNVHEFYNSSSHLTKTMKTIVKQCLAKQEECYNFYKAINYAKQNKKINKIQNWVYTTVNIKFEYWNETVNLDWEKWLNSADECKLLQTEYLRFLSFFLNTKTIIYTKQSINRA